MSAAKLEVSPAHGCYVATEGEQIIGAIVFETDGKEAFIHAVGVRKPWRLQGVATELKQRVVDYLGKTGVGYYYSYVHASNSRMKRLNERRFRLDGQPDESGKYLLYGSAIVVDDEDV
jgi:GNAT superfamily N-acetyltransferase